ncbi:hypothetical protein D3C73_1498980 [compost metagenome]
MSPPEGMASRALTIRFSKALSTWVGSVQTKGKAAGSRFAIWTWPPMVRRRKSIIPRTRPQSSTGSSRKSCLRAKASMRRVSEAPRSAPWKALSISGVILGS